MNQEVLQKRKQVPDILLKYSMQLMIFKPGKFESFAYFHIDFPKTAITHAEKSFPKRHNVEKAQKKVDSAVVSVVWYVFDASKTFFSYI